MIAYKANNLTDFAHKVWVYYCCPEIGKPADVEAQIANLAEQYDCVVWYGSDCEYDLRQMNVVVVPMTPVLLRSRDRVMTTELPYAVANGIPVALQSGYVGVLPQLKRHAPWLVPVALGDAVIEAQDHVAEESERRKLVTRCRLESGKLVKDKEFEEAERTLQRGLRVAYRLANETESLPACRELTLIYEKLGDLCYDRQNFSMAEYYYWLEQIVAQIVAEADPSDKYMIDLRIAWNDRGRAARELALWDEAEQYYLKAKEVGAVIMERNTTAKTLSNLAFSTLEVGEARMKKKDAEGALAAYKETYAINLQREELGGITNELRYDLLLVCERLGNAYKALGDEVLAEEFYQKEVYHAELYQKEEGGAAGRKALSIAYYKKAAFYAETGNDEKALDLYQKAVENDRAALREEENETTLHRFVSHGLDLGDHLNKMKRAGDALAVFLEVYEVNLRREESASMHLNQFICCERLGDIYAKTERSRAEKYYMEYIDHGIAYDKDRQTVGSARNMGIAYVRVGDFYESTDRLKAQAYYLRNVEVRADIAKRSDEIQDLSRLAYGYYLLGNVSTGADRKKYLQKSVDTYDLLIKRDPNNLSYAKNRRVIARMIEL